MPRRIDVLRQRGLLYRCFCSRAGTARLVSAHEAAGTPWPRDPDGAPFHAGPCADLSERESAARAASGAPHSWRLRMARGDGADRGGSERSAASTRRAATPANARRRAPELGRCRARPRDVPTSYHLSVVLDDALQGVTHVVRGADLERATDVHRVLQTLLGLPSPLYHHHRLLPARTGSKLAKSADSTAAPRIAGAGQDARWVRRQVGRPHGRRAPERRYLTPSTASQNVVVDDGKRRRQRDRAGRDGDGGAVALGEEIGVETAGRGGEQHGHPRPDRRHGEHVQGEHVDEQRLQQQLQHRDGARRAAAAGRGHSASARCPWRTARRGWRRRRACRRWS